MRMIDLIALTTDLSKNAALKARSGDVLYPITTITKASDGVIILALGTVKQHARHNWELATLGKQSDWRRQPVMLDHHGERLPLYGCAFRDAAIILH